MGHLKIALSGRASFDSAIHACRPPMLAIVCMTFVACTNDRTHPTGPEPAVAAIAQLDAGELTDPQIDPSDSYLITHSVTRTTTTLESSEAFIDPLTGNQVTTLTFPEVVDSTRFEAGYDAAGSVRLNELRTGTDSGSRAQRLVIANNAATFYDATGAVVYDTSGPVLMEAFGSTDNLVVTQEAVLRNDEISSDVEAGLLPHAPRETDASVHAVERRGDRLLRHSSLDDPASGVRGTRTRQYRRAGDEWVIASERIETTQAWSGMTLHVLETTTYPSVKWNLNRRNDDRRRQLRAETASASTAHVASDASAPVFNSRRTGPEQENTFAASLQHTFATPACVVCADGGDGDIIDPRILGQPRVSVNLALQHGAYSDSTAWRRIEPWLRAHYNVVHGIVPTLNWRESLDVQAAHLNQLLLASGGTNFLVIGHSNGGLVARRAAQLGTVTTQRLIGGVIAISSPHAGLPLALNARQVVGSVLETQVQSVLRAIGGNCGRREYAWLCEDLTDVVLTFVPRIVNYAFDNAIPMSAQVKPGSAFTAAMNATPEDHLRYSIEFESQGAWKFVRMLGDWKCNPEDRCSGNHLQNMMESAYEVLRRCGSNEFSKLIRPSVAERCRSVRWSLNNLNTVYERFIAPGDESDGLVPARSQAYPGVAVDDRAVLRRAKESHVGELKSLTTRDRVRTLTDKFLMNRL